MFDTEPESYWLCDLRRNVRIELQCVGATMFGHLASLFGLQFQAQEREEITRPGHSGAGLIVGAHR